jgi:hypothetical protein
MAARLERDIQRAAGGSRSGLLESDDFGMRAAKSLVIPGA